MKKAKIDTSGARWELSRGEKAAIRWFEKHGFSGTLDRQFLSKTYFTVTKNGVTDTTAIPMGDPKINYYQYMDLYNKSFEMKCKIRQAKKEE